MSGVIYRALPKVSLDFSSVTANNSSIFVAARNIEVYAYREASALIRVHNAITAGVGATFKVDVLADAQTDEDQFADFVGAASLTNMTAVAPTPGLTVLNVNGPFGGHVRVQVTCSQGSVASTYYITLSVDIIAKS